MLLKHSKDESGKTSEELARKEKKREARVALAVREREKICSEIEKRNKHQEEMNSSYFSKSSSSKMFQSM